MRKHISHYNRNSCSFLEVKADTSKAIITESVTGADLSEPRYILEKDR